MIALAAISVPHYLEPISMSFTEGAAELVTAGVVIVAVAAINIVNFSGRRHEPWLVAAALGGVLLLVAVVVVGAITSFDASALTAELDLFVDTIARGCDLRGGDRDGRIRRHRGGLGPDAGPAVSRQWTSGG